MTTERVFDLRTGGVAERPFVAPPPSVPHSVSPRQARLALRAAGLLDAAETAIAAAGEDALISWEYATEFVRTEPLIEAMRVALGLTVAQIDDLFRDAATR